MNEIISTIRKNTVASWGAALFMGLVFRYVDAIARNQIFNWCRNWDFGSSTQPTPESQFLALTITFNLTLNLASSLIASVLCGGLLVYVFQERASRLSVGSLVVFFALSSRIWRFWKFPEVGMQISSLMGPIVAGIIFVLTVFLLGKVRRRITSGDSGLR